MAITSVGYAGSITDNNWRRMATAAVGSLYGVEDFSSWNPTIGTGDRATRIAGGAGFGLGVRDVSDAPVNLTHSPVVSGSRWDLIVARRNWSTKTTVFAIIEGSSVMALPDRSTGFGTTNDQPIALVRITSGQSTVQEILDLRCIPGDGGLFAFHDLSRTYLDRVGTSVRIGDIVWDRIVDGLGSPTWVASRDLTVQHQGLGAAVVGISVPGTLSAPGLMTVKTGQVTDFGSIAFGNQYMSAVVFPTPFPNRLLSVQLTQIHQQSDLTYAHTAIAVDGATASGFRALYPGATSAVKRSFLWTAFGY